MREVLDKTGERYHLRGGAVFYQVTEKSGILKCIPCPFTRTAHGGSMLVDDALRVLENLDYKIWFHNEVRILAQNGTLFSVEWHHGNWMVCVNRLPPLVVGITCDLLQTIQIAEDFRHTLRNNYSTDRLLTNLQRGHFHTAIVAPNKIAVYSLFYAWDRVEFYTFIQTNFNAINYADPAMITIEEAAYTVTTEGHQQSFTDIQAVTDFLKDNRYLFFPWI